MPKYTVTKSAPDELYDKRVKAGDTIELTEAQAEWPVKRGAIEPVSQPVAQPKKTDGKRG